MRWRAILSPSCPWPAFFVLSFRIPGHKANLTHMVDLACSPYSTWTAHSFCSSIHVQWLFSFIPPTDLLPEPSSVFLSSSIFLKLVFRGLKVPSYKSLASPVRITPGYSDPIMNRNISIISCSCLLLVWRDVTDFFNIIVHPVIVLEVFIISRKFLMAFGGFFFFVYYIISKWG